MFADSTLHRQVPGLQPKKLPHKQRGVSKPKNRSRPDLVGRILAQRAQRAEINQERLLPVQQPPASPQMSHTEPDGRQRGNRPNIQLDSPHLRPQAPHPNPLEQEQQPGRSTVVGAGAKNDSDNHQRDLYPSQQPPLQTQCSGKELPDEVQMDSEEDGDQERRREDILEPLPPPAKRKVAFAMLFLRLYLYCFRKTRKPWTQK